MYTETTKTDHVQKIIKALNEGKTYDRIQKGLTTSFGLTEQEATALLAQAQTKINTDKKVAIREQMTAELQNLAENDHGIDAESVDVMEAKIRELLDEDVLKQSNDQLAPKGRRLTYRDLSIIGCIHRRSIKEQRGESPYERFSTLALAGKLSEKPYDARQINYALRLLKVIGFTSGQLTPPIPPKWVDGKKQKGKAATYEWYENA